MTDASGMARNGVDAVTDSVSRGAASARQHASDLLEGTADALQDMRDDFMDDERVQQVRRKAKRAASASRDYFSSHDVEDIAADVVDAVRKHPGKALIAMAATGYVLGRLFRGSR